MLTIRIEHKKQGQPQRTVMSVVKYQVADDGTRETATLIVPNTGERFQLENGGVAYVMNEKGVTVDVVRTYPPRT